MLGKRQVLYNDPEDEEARQSKINKITEEIDARVASGDLEGESEEVEEAEEANERSEEIEEEEVRAEEEEEVEERPENEAVRGDEEVEE